MKVSKVSKNYAAGLVGKIPMGEKGDKAHSVIILALGMKGCKAEVSMNGEIISANPEQLKAISKMAMAVEIDTAADIISKIASGLTKKTAIVVKAGKKK